MKKNLLTIEEITPTTYEDGTSWVVYSIGEKIGYEIIEGEELPDYKKMLNEKKPTLEVCSPYLAEIIENCHRSENEMWFVEYDDEDLEKIDLEKLEDEVYELGIEKYFEFDNTDAAITVFGGIITKFMF